MLLIVDRFKYNKEISPHVLFKSCKSNMDQHSLKYLKIKKILKYELVKRIETLYNQNELLKT